MNENPLLSISRFHSPVSAHDRALMRRRNGALSPGQCLNPRWRPSVGLLGKLAPLLREPEPSALIAEAGHHVDLAQCSSWRFDLL